MVGARNLEQIKEEIGNRIGRRLLFRRVNYDKIQFSRAS